MKIADMLYVSSMYEHLGEVGFYAYEQNCPGLTVAECETLEELCDKAKAGIEEDYGRTLEYYIKSIIKEERKYDSLEKVN